MPALAAVAAAGAGLVSCGTSNTVDYLYATSSTNNPGQINVYRVDSQSGALTQIPDSPYPAGRNPVSLVASGTGQTLYVANLDDNTIIQFGIGSDAKLYGQHTINLPGSGPQWLAIHSYFDMRPGMGNKYLGSLLLVLQNYQPNFSVNNVSPGALSVYQIPPAPNSGLTDAALTGSPVTQTLNGQPS